MNIIEELKQNKNLSDEQFLYSTTKQKCYNVLCLNS